jgi:hypothetical protein
MILEPNCSKRRCVHFRLEGRVEGMPPSPVCAAFPKGIPEEIAYGDNLHLEPYPGDHGIQYEAEAEVADNDEDAATFADQMWEMALEYAHLKHKSHWSVKDFARYLSENCCD